MLVKQISVFLENKSGRLAEVTKILGENEINISALSIADTTDFGILRLIVNNPEKAEAALKDNGFTVSCTSVIAIGVSDQPGGLSVALDILDKESIGIEYMYAFVGRPGDEAYVILRVEEPDRAIEVLTKKDIKVLSSSAVYEL
ncbi:MAG: ACT domain-containing protein [Clostridia bacterium]|nr:ACT domain-containing protein [Clostridia bacterium]